LLIRRAVFLPLGDGQEQVPSAPGAEDPGLPGRVTLTMHGAFFVDAGRRDVDGLTPEEPGERDPRRAIKFRWNRRLFRDGALPLLLPALSDLAGAGVFGTDELGALTRLLMRSQHFTQWRSAICRGHQWLCRLTAGGLSWRLEPGVRTFEEVP